VITVLEAGLLTTVQDAGRRGYRGHGVPLAGAMDSFAYAVANLLAANPPGAAALEMTLLGGSFRFERWSLVAVAGADMQARLDDRPFENWTARRVPAGSQLSFGLSATGSRAYLAIRGGIDVPAVLGSRSTYTRAGIGGFNGRALEAGDVLPVARSAPPPWSERDLPARFVPSYTSDIRLRLMLGPQDDLFAPDGIDTLFARTYRVTDKNDRMGWQLEGPPVRHREGPDIVSDAVCPGAVQVPGSGMPIILGADCQTTGGYAKVGVVAGVDLSALAQARVGHTIRFVQCSDAAAVDALRAQREVLRRIAQKLTEGCRGNS
jgi:antagonist of KipI